jgi:hypothetical protein
LDRNQLSRIVWKNPHSDSDTTIPFSSPEHVNFSKLEWDRLGNEVCEQQWLDVIGIIKVMIRDLHFDYLKSWAQQHDVSNLLQRAIEDTQ